MEIREYSYILAVAECGSVSKAAEKLFISQPSLSAYIKNLERRLGFPFFVEGSGKTQLTTEGELYIKYAQQIMTLNDNLHRQLEDVKNLKRGLVRIGVANTRATFLLPRLLAAAGKNCPDIKIEIHEATSRALEQALSMRELDFAVLNYPFHTEGIEYIELLEEEFVVVLPKNHPASKKAVLSEESQYPWIDIRDVANEPFVLLRQGQRMRQIADMLFTQAAIHPNIMCETSSSITTLFMTEMGLGMSFTLDSHLTTYNPFIMGGHPEIEVFAVGTPPITSKLVAAYLPGQKLSKASKTIISLLRDIL